jgi:hypothetical protein
MPETKTFLYRYDTDWEDEDEVTVFGTRSTFRALESLYIRRIELGTYWVLEETSTVFRRYRVRHADASRGDHLN